MQGNQENNVLELSKTPPVVEKTKIVVSKNYDWNMSRTTNHQRNMTKREENGKPKIAQKG